MKRNVMLFSGGLVLFAGVLLLEPSPAPAASNKIEVCHVPPGNPDNFHTITISDKALAAHLAHGDFVGACNALCAVLCDDGDLCTVDDTGNCEDEGCPAYPREAVDCGEATQCTKLECYPAVGCVDEVLEGAPCDDGAVCTSPDTCDAEGVCAGIPDLQCCEDHDACNPTYCNGNYCNAVNECDTTGPPCEDLIECTVDMCTDDPAGCENVATDALCDDEVDCTEDSCDPTEDCKNVPDDELCDDGVGCTINDHCDPVDGCQVTLDDSRCFDDLACTINEYCDPVNGCQATLSHATCDDLDRCTNDTCDPSSPAVDGCTHSPIVGCCNGDGDCAAGEQCDDAAGVCEPIPVDPPCFTMLKAPMNTNISQCINSCNVQAMCDPQSVCSDKIASQANIQLVQNCINRSDYPNACLLVDNYGKTNGCDNICDPVTCNFPNPPGLVLDEQDWSGTVGPPGSLPAAIDACVSEALAQGCQRHEQQIRDRCQTLLSNDPACVACTRQMNPSPGACGACGQLLFTQFQGLGCTLVVPTCIP